MQTQTPTPTNRDELERHQLTRLNDPESGLSLLRAQNAFYRTKLDGIALPLASLEAFTELPFTLKSELVDDQQQNPPYGTNLTYEPGAYNGIHATSGTTGRRLKCLDTRESWAWFTYCWQEIYRAIGVGSDDRVFAAFGFGPFVGFWAGFEAAQQIGALAIPAGAQSSDSVWIGFSKATQQFCCRHRRTRCGSSRSRARRASISHRLRSRTPFMRESLVRTYRRSAGGSRPRGARSVGTMPV